MLAGYKLLVEPYFGKPIAVLPFEPTTMFGFRDRLAHYGLKDPKMMQASSVSTKGKKKQQLRPLLPAERGTRCCRVGGSARDGLPTMAQDFWCE